MYTKPYPYWQTTRSELSAGARRVPFSFCNAPYAASTPLGTWKVMSFCLIVHDLYSCLALVFAQHPLQKWAAPWSCFLFQGQFTPLVHWKSPCMKRSVGIVSSNATKKTPDIILAVTSWASWSNPYSPLLNLAPNVLDSLCVGPDLSPLMFSVYFLLGRG